MAKINDNEYNMLRLVDTGLPLNSRNLREFGIPKKEADYLVIRLKNRGLLRDTGYKLTHDGHKVLAEYAKKLEVPND